MTLWAKVNVSGPGGRPVSPEDEQRALQQVRQQKGVFDIPDKLMHIASCMHILTDAYGYERSLDEGVPVDGSGAPIPLYTYPAIEYLRQLDFSDAVVFEYGSGQSTVFWSARARKVYAVEHDPDWRARLERQGLANVQVLAADEASYVGAIEGAEPDYDVVIVDGHGHRYDCAVAGRAKLKAGGLMLLDNADWHPNTAAFLRDSGLIQIDMTGFKPTYYHASTTSLFLERGFARKPASGRQPAVGWGGLEQVSPWDKPGGTKPGEG